MSTMSPSDMSPADFIAAADAALWADEWCQAMLVHPRRREIMFMVEAGSGFTAEGGIN